MDVVSWETFAHVILTGQDYLVCASLVLGRT